MMKACNGWVGLAEGICLESGTGLGSQPRQMNQCRNTSIGVAGLARGREVNHVHHHHVLMSGRWDCSHISIITALY